MFTGDAGEVLMVVHTIVEEASHSLGQHLTVVGDEAVPGVTDTFAAQQGAGGRWQRSLEQDPLLGWLVCSCCWGSPPFRRAYDHQCEVG